jgi:hypothetical protein
MLFEPRLRAGLHDGSITVAFRRWKRPQVTAGGRYRTGSGLIEVAAIDSVELGSIDDADAARAGYLDADALLADLRGDPELPLYRVVFRPCSEPDARDVLAHTASITSDDVAAITRRLDGFDARADAPWTLAALTAIGERPGVRAGDLADELGLERLDFKSRVRKLKELGLTLSLTVGYELSPRGRAYLAGRSG